MLDFLKNVLSLNTIVSQKITTSRLVDEGISFQAGEDTQMRMASNCLHLGSQVLPPIGGHVDAGAWDRNELG